MEIFLYMYQTTFRASTRKLLYGNLFSSHHFIECTHSGEAWTPLKMIVMYCSILSYLNTIEIFPLMSNTQVYLCSVTCVVFQVCTYLSVHLWPSVAGCVGAEFVQPNQPKTHPSQRVDNCPWWFLRSLIITVNSVLKRWWWWGNAAWKSTVSGYHTS